MPAALFVTSYNQDPDSPRYDPTAAVYSYIEGAYSGTLNVFS